MQVIGKELNQAQPASNGVNFKNNNKMQDVYSSAPDRIYNGERMIFLLSSSLLHNYLLNYTYNITL